MHQNLTFEVEGDIIHMQYAVTFASLKRCGEYVVQKFKHVSGEVVFTKVTSAQTSQND